MADSQQSWRLRQLVIATVLLATGEKSPTLAALLLVWTFLLCLQLALLEAPAGMDR